MCNNDSDLKIISVAARRILCSKTGCKCTTYTTNHPFCTEL